MTMHADEIPTSVALVRRLLAAQFPQWADLPISRVTSSGTVNALYRLGEDLVVRLPLVERAAADIRREQTWLPRLAPLPVATPVPVGQGVPGAGYPCDWSVLRWIEGENPVVGDIPGVAEDLAEFVVALRRIDPGPGPASDRGGPLSHRDHATRQAISELHGIIDTDAATAAWEEASRAPEWSSRPVWTHGDLGPGNVLTADGGLRAVIDFGVVGVGDPAVDLIPAWNLFTGQARETFRSGVDVDDATWARGRGWALSISLIQLPYYRETNPVIAANSVHVIDEILAEHRSRSTP
ncbi:aminoglycoside phosphotransferase family protein [Kibdelosporangium persicum]|uniref:Aminoglycoside phosphotransferase n=1 Tax=Kibdelosporangium persicum TaxID=2698649 RepID=A0ABX2F195_9PSEU|nr:aminoglycoside phosphotransferase family protein [Kibdelosporangium persicum]NRN65080.1 Aminoglycoside phosphotransferase [Kibdelosporangium persicum]